MSEAKKQLNPYIGATILALPFLLTVFFIFGQFSPSANLPIITLLKVSAALILISSILWGAVLISKSDLSDGVKLGWIFLIIFAPLIGSICASIVVTKR